MATDLGVPRDTVVGGTSITGVTRYVFIQYFVELNHVGLPGTGNDGDRTVCLGKIDRTTGATVLDTAFTDELLGTPCLDFEQARGRATAGCGRARAARRAPPSRTRQPSSATAPRYSARATTRRHPWTWMVPLDAELLKACIRMGATREGGAHPAYSGSL